ncbi:MAG: hypothetical protein AUI12_18425 [Acidobacteria bacterium 13_2_20CM_2_57_6]|nr:MAG: hypothetical protein AUI12_18425 [Acidobacteria bacterium 13_2_20CM_2_57_6]
MNTALQLSSAPAPGPGVVWVCRHRSARLASNAEIAFVVLRKVANAIRVGVVPNLCPVPVGEKADLPELFASGETVKLNLLEALTRWGLLPAQAGEPNVEWFQGTEKRFDFAQLAAASGIGLIKNAKRRFLLSHGSRRQDVNQV